MILLRRDRLTSIISYFGIQFDVTDEWRWLATDADGAVFLYKQEPMAFGNCWVTGNDYVQVAVVDLEGLSWTDSLIGWGV